MVKRVTDVLLKVLGDSELGRFLIAARDLRWRMANGVSPIYLDYPLDPSPRYGFGKPPHPRLRTIFETQRAAYFDLIRQFRLFADSLSTIPIDKPNNPIMPYWNNGFIGGLEAILLCSLPAIHNSKRYIEIGSGNSTKFVRHSIVINGLRTTITSIDPKPRAEIDGICDNVIRCGLEKADLTIFDQLESGDILMFDGSHCCFQNSDVTVFFLEVLPRLKPGVLVYIDDIYLPFDYPPAWRNRFYSEQYVLATLLMARPRRHKILLPCVFIGRDEALRTAADTLTGEILPAGIGGYGSGFCMRIVDDGYGGNIEMFSGDAPYRELRQASSD